MQRLSFFDETLMPGDVEVIGYNGQTIYQEPPIHHLLRNFDDSTDLVSRWPDVPTQRP
jgi:anhydro-N-acetylmuramic acid kinase